MASQNGSVTCTEKCWRSTRPGLLVGDGDISAIALFARKTQVVTRPQAEAFSNAHAFFNGIDAPKPEPKPVVSAKLEKAGK